MTRLCVRMCLVCKKLPNCLLKWLCHFACPSATSENSCCSASSCVFGGVRVLHDPSSKRWGNDNSASLTGEVRFKGNVACEAQGCPTGSPVRLLFQGNHLPQSPASASFICLGGPEWIPLSPLSSARCPPAGAHPQIWVFSGKHVSPGCAAGFVPCEQDVRGAGTPRRPDSWVLAPALPPTTCVACLPLVCTGFAMNSCYKCRNARKQ